MVSAGGTAGRRKWTTDLHRRTDGIQFAHSSKSIYRYCAPETQRKTTMQIRLSAVISVATLAAATAFAQGAPPRPKITGISHIAVYTSDPAATESYYTTVIGAVKLPDPENPKGVRYDLSATQYVEVLPLPANEGVERLDHTAWITENAEGMRKYLAAGGWKVPSKVERGKDGSRYFAVLDPENNKVEFVQPPANPKPVDAPNAIGHHIIHVGYMTHDRAAEDKFYRDLLGFRPYWYGGRNGQTNWISQQCPDGHDWMEYMMTRGTSGIPADMTQQSLGVMDHFSIGVVSVPDTFQALTAANRLTGQKNPAAKVGLDGKYQLNLYDPDGTRSEVMNFHHTQEPCCSAFTAEDPAE
jgi:catechol 2,3-dioxygenase-like lactoylglutathione lyase family enzyme